MHSRVAKLLGVAFSCSISAEVSCPVLVKAGKVPRPELARKDDCSEVYIVRFDFVFSFTHNQ